MHKENKTSQLRTVRLMIPQTSPKQVNIIESGEMELKVGIDENIWKQQKLWQKRRVISKKIDLALAYSSIFHSTFF